MVSRQETARPLLTPGEVMQLPPADELVLVSGSPPIRAKKARYFEDARLTERILPPAAMTKHGVPPPDDWSRLTIPAVNTGGEISSASTTHSNDFANGGIRRQPDLPKHEEIAPERANPEFVFSAENSDNDALRARALRRQVLGLARQVALDPGDGMELSE